jgi:peptidoglycan/xylan/chitin deacetylase (PgdA/CDA1 family)
MLRLLSGAAISGAAAGPLIGAGRSSAGPLGGAQPIHAEIGGLAADGEVPPPPPPPPDDRYEVPAVFSHGDRNGDRIYLTFDDCYSPSLVAQAMDIAEAGGARLTFFPVGTVLGQNPDLWRDVLARGHAIEDHTWDHTLLSGLSDSDVWSEMAHHMEALRAVVGSDYQEQFIRPPGGAGIFDYQQRIPDIAMSLGMKVCMWSVDSNGWRIYPRQDADAISYIVSNVMQDFGPGSIVLQHVLANDVAALPQLVDEADRRGLKAVTLSAGIK